MVSAPAIAQQVLPAISCEVPAAVSFPAPGSAPLVTVWHSEDLRRIHWVPPDCTGWKPEAATRLVVSMTGSFVYTGTADDLLARAGAISTLSSVRYWSTTNGRWRQLINDASALGSAAPQSRRKDFSASELKAPLVRHYWIHDSRLGDIVYAMRVKFISPTEVVVLTENETAVRAFFVTMFAPSTLQSMVIFKEQSQGVWGAYAVSRIGAGTSALAIASDRSFINRAVALYRHLSGTPTDLEPPVAR